jgi:hypothetical protein
VLCDLISAQAAVLERDVSPEVAATYERTAVGHAETAHGDRGDVDPLAALDRDARRLRGRPETLEVLISELLVRSTVDRQPAARA